MRWLLFLSRLAFICGVFFALSFSMLLNAWISDPTLESTIITIGYIMGMIILPLTNLCYLAVLLVKRKLRPYVPLWLVIANLLFLLFLIYFIFYLNDPYYHQK
jgi:glucan phosphoethanolaminetransferase (alkaline phosphatase superfamily)